MRLLFDENLSARLIEYVGDVYPEAEQVLEAGLGGAGDSAVWEYAKLRGLAIDSKDSDFFDRSVLATDPPKIIWIRLGNCSTREVARVLRAEVEAVRRFLADDVETCLILGCRRGMLRFSGWSRGNGRERSRV